ncbi:MULTISPECIES: protein phosphatase CheZ [Vibrio]|jgi:chemotaxis protein CheZ|uniref:Protein phosphatase CheZ n=1 Tax=Vibrio natriegens NBRC 15636 = ATCC 14048 = DSM 759 TaxID=1219067 RepID=A0AAN0Y3R3_VIBNA|nr:MULTISPECIES: protein phosphatase CheZ [Vibrio]MEE3879661.1 protein phosphatase CheZ [Vibrio sp. YYF0003]CAH0531386.1 Protein phosphatase CheZ [Catenococcus thiocycli]AEX22775.1 chemotaxis protein CheZ [Vibrio sp. EJY3]ALR14942.1 protein phosphatase [Vibrio natriegens NBRC 15636 = ATCC 14048 = DSM 759]ANQ13194.1 protein phosphatase [Vibrio natriegens NBRC 15636 = ATCC 14048 = DSM 759]
MISLEQAKSLVQMLENGQQEQANMLVASLYEGVENPMLQEIGALTRDLHDSLKQFNFDQRMTEIAQDEIPDARDRLNYVIEKTELAANKTMDAVDCCLPIADNLHEGLLQVRPQWNELMRGRIELSEFKALCHRIDKLLVQVEGDSTELRGQLTEILMAQDFQDLTGQIIRRVITLVNEVEGRLVDILTVFSGNKPEEQTQVLTTSADKKNKPSSEAEGPILHPELREDAVSSQDEVDDLLSSLGF